MKRIFAISRQLEDVSDFEDSFDENCEVTELILKKLWEKLTLVKNLVSFFFAKRPYAERSAKSKRELAVQ